MTIKPDHPDADAVGGVVSEDDLIERMPWVYWEDDEVEDELSLPEADLGELAGPPWWEWMWPSDDRAVWERQVGLRQCVRCRELNVVDPLGRCARCRTAIGRCSWCGLDPLVYRRAMACRTCYRWLRRNAKGLEVDVVADRLLTAAARRHRQRRKRVPNDEDGH